MGGLCRFRRSGASSRWGGEAMTDKPECICSIPHLFRLQGHHELCPVASWIPEKDGGYQPCAGGKTLEEKG